MTGTFNRRCRVLHVIDKLSMDGVNPSSCALSLIEWVAHRDRERFDVMVASLRPLDPAGRHLEDQGVRVFYLTHGKYSFANVGALATLVRRERIDLLHFHGYAAANFGRLAARRTGAPAVMHEHAVLSVLPHQFAMDWLLRHKTDVAVAVSEAVREFLVRGRAVPRGKTRVVWNGVSLDLFRGVDPAEVRRRRREFGFDDHQEIVGTITRLREEKGNRYFIEAVPRILREISDARFLVVGDGPLRTELGALARRLGLADRLHFAGFRSDIPVVLGVLDVAVMASLTEGFPVALVEAMAAGKPIVATAVGGISEIIRHEGNGLLIPPADPAALAAAIVRTLGDRVLRARLGRAARERSQAFSIQRTVAALQAIYAELLRLDTTAAEHTSS